VISVVKNTTSLIKMSSIVNPILKHSNVIVIIGRRNSGKTDFSLLIAEECYSQAIEKGVSFRVATNISCQCDFIEYICDYQTLKKWIRERGRKLYILDEAGIAINRRRPMGKLTIAIIEIIQLIRKFKSSLIFIGQNPKVLDTAIFDPAILDAIVKKLSWKNAIYRDLVRHRQKIITEIPGTTVRFDSRDVAPFTMKPIIELKDLTPEMQVRKLYKSGLSFHKIAKELGYGSPTQVIRVLRKSL